MQAGREARRRVPRITHGQWSPAAKRPDPVNVLEAQAASRVPELVPIRYGRMLSSPFAFFRGAAAVMAYDLADTPVSGFDVQACGDAHVSNFGVFASAEREMLFDVNDFDETLPAPWEWDVKRLAASLAVAGRDRGFTDRQRAAVVASAVGSYRRAIRRFAQVGHLDVWYARLDSIVVEQWLSELRPAEVRKVEAGAAKARGKDSTRALAKLAAEQDGEMRFLSDPPLLVPVAKMFGADDRDALQRNLQGLLDSYAESLRPELRRLTSGYTVVDIARKVVGVGSVGTHGWVILLTGRDGHDPLILQAKEAEASVLEAHTAPSEFPNHGQRVVVGQRAMQAASDIFLGWVRAPDPDGTERDYYVRQLWDWKGSIALEQLVPRTLQVLGEMCAWTLARAHARTGDRIAIAAYLGSGDAFDTAMTRFAEAYADQNEKDHNALADAVLEGRVSAVQGV